MPGSSSDFNWDSFGGGDSFGSSKDMPDWMKSVGSGVDSLPNTGATQQGGGSIFDFAGGGGAGKNPSASVGDYIGAGAAGAGLAFNLFNQNSGSKRGIEQSFKDESALLGQQSQDLFTRGQGLQNWLTSGQLPPELQAQLDLNKAGGKARLVQNQAGTTGVTDPTRNSALTQDLNTLDQQALAAKGQEEKLLFDAGSTMIGEATKMMGMEFDLQKKIYDMDRQDQQDIMGAITGFAKMLGPMFAMSDRRLKTDIHPIGKLRNGLPLYNFRFKGHDEVRIGVMADEVEKVYPHLVATDERGFKMVDYAGVLNAQG